MGSLVPSSLTWQLYSEPCSLLLMTFIHLCPSSGAPFPQLPLSPAVALCLPSSQSSFRNIYIYIYVHIPGSRRQTPPYHSFEPKGWG